MMGFVSARPRLLFALLAATISVAPVRSAPQDGQSAPLSFDAFLADVRTEALGRGIKAETMDRAFADLKPAPKVVARDRRQPEAVQSLDSYLAQRLTKSTVATARDMAAQHRIVLDRVEAEYGVPRELIVAIWGLESNFGRFTGSYPTVQALATLAYDNRRPLFREELIDALTMIDRGLVTPEMMKGSWAGAMGQPQFMPSSFLKHAVDFNGDGSIDIWRSPVDVLGSMANYLKNRGWTPGERWGREVAVSRTAQAAIDQQLPMRTDGCRATRTMTVARPLSAWSALGVTLIGGRALPTADVNASLVKGAKRSFLVYSNYDVIIDYNCSHSYALAAGLLSDMMRQ
jgi:membrane-bound lytic murein transglycosylase B